MKQVVAILLLSLQPFLNDSWSQTRVVVLGSSTAAGTGASVYDSSWVERLQAEFRKNTVAGNPDTIVTNLAVGGTTTYYVMPTGYIPPAGRPAPDQEHNVTKALSFAPELILINFPTNDIGAGYTQKEYMDNLRYLFHYINNAGTRVYIATTQPRSQYDFNKRLSLFQLVDSVKNNFGMYGIDFWSDLATTDGQYNLLPQVNSGDGVHVNNLGHRLLFQRVKAKNIFASNAQLPLSLSNFRAEMQNNSVVLQWHAEQQGSNSFFEIQRCPVNKEFITIAKKEVNGSSPTDYSWTDINPLPGKSLYRLKIVEANKISYSKAIEIVFSIQNALIQNLSLNASALQAQIGSGRDKIFSIRIINLSGAIVYEQTTFISTPGLSISIPIANLSNGQYFLQVSAIDVIETRRFIKF